MSGLTVTLEQIQHLPEFKNKTSCSAMQKTMHVIDISYIFGFDLFVRALEIMNTPESIRMSRLIARHLAAEAIDSGVRLINIAAEAHKIIDEFSVAIIDGSPLLDLMWRAISFSKYYEGIDRGQADDAIYFSTSCLRDMFIPCDFEPNEDFTEEMLQEEASSAARRTYEGLLEVLIRTTPEYKAAVEVAQAAINGEREWQEGTSTKFKLVESPVWDVLYKINSDIASRPEFIAGLDGLCHAACHEVLVELS